MRYSFCAPLVINPVVLILQTARRETVRRSTQDLLERGREREEGKKRRNVSFLMHARGGGVTRATLCNVVESFVRGNTRRAENLQNREKSTRSRAKLATADDRLANTACMFPSYYN